MAKKKFEDELEIQLLKLTTGQTRNLLDEALAPPVSLVPAPAPESPPLCGLSAGPAASPQGLPAVAPGEMGEPDGSTWLGHDVEPRGSSERRITQAGPGLTMPTQLNEPFGLTLSIQKDEPFPGRTRHEKSLLGYISRHGAVSGRIKLFAEKLDIPPASLYKIIPRLCRLGLLGKEDMGNDGLRLWVTQMVQPCTTKGLIQMDHHGSTNRVNQEHSKRDRKEKNLSSGEPEQSEAWTDELIAAMWGAVARVGFGARQIRQILELRRAAGHPALQKAELSVSLDRADWELEERGCLTDLKTREAVKNPNGYLFTALVKFGAFRAHPEYVNRAEELARDVAAEIRRNEDAEFAAWLASLSREQKERIVEKKPGGPEEPWLRLHWAKNVRNG